MAISYVWESRCNGCAECTHCGRDEKEQVAVYTCDKCGDESYDPDDMYEFDGNILCEECLLEQIPHPM